MRSLEKHNCSNADSCDVASRICQQGNFAGLSQMSTNMKLKNTLRWLAGEEPITHLGLDYYDDLVD